jgi:aspartate aminotransferase
LPTLLRRPIRLTGRVRDIQSSPTLAVLNKARALTDQGIDVIDFGAGEPDFPTPSSVAAAGKRAIDEGRTRYTNALGCDELRLAISEFYNRRFGTDLRPENIIAGTGGKQELFNLMLALVEEGDEVIIPSPYWVSFPDQVSFAGGTPVFTRTDSSNGFRPTLEAIRAVATPQTRGLILNSPCNPTGAVMEEEELERIIRFCHERGLFLIFDETYEFFVYDRRRHVSAVRWFSEFPETVIAVNSMSKTFAMTGWRLGFAVGHPEIISAIGKIQSHSTSNPSSISQHAAIDALQGGEEEVRRMYEAYVERRAWLIPALNAIDGFQCAMPDGAFYVFPDVSALYAPLGLDGSESFSTFLLDEARVAVVPGKAFGADDYIRISYATSLDHLHEGVRRIEAALGRRRA